MYFTDKSKINTTTTKNGQNDQFMIFIRNFLDVEQRIFTDLNNVS